MAGGRELIQVELEDGTKTWLVKRPGASGTPEAHVQRIETPIRDMLYSEEPRLYDKLVNRRPMSWFEISGAVDVMSRAASMEAMRAMNTTSNLHEIRRALQLIERCYRLSERIDPLGPRAALTGTRRGAQNEAARLLNLPA